MEDAFAQKFEALCKEENIELAYISFTRRIGDANYDPPYPPKHKYDFQHGRFIADELEKALDRLDDKRPDGHKFTLAADAWRLLEHATTAQELLKTALASMAEDHRACQSLEAMMKDRLGIYSARMVPLKMNTLYYIETEDGPFLMSYDDRLAWDVKKLKEDGALEVIPLEGHIYMGCIVPDPERDAGEVLNLDGLPIVALGCKMLWGRPQQIGAFSQVNPAWHTSPVRSLIEATARQ